MIKNFSEQLYQMLPPIYRKEDANIKPYKEPLKRYLKILSEGGFEVSLKSIEEFLSIRDIDNVDSKYLPLIAKTLGLDFPYIVDENTQRKFLKVVPVLYKLKGTESSFNYLAREIFSTKSKITTTVPQYKEGISYDRYPFILNSSTLNNLKFGLSSFYSKEELRKIYLNIEVDGALPDLQRKEENFRKFVEIVRPVNRILVINLIFMYYENYRFDELVRDLYDFDKLIFNEGEDELLRAITDPNFDLMRTDYATDLFDFTKVTTSYTTVNLADLSADVHDTKARTRMYFSVINLQDSERSDDRTQVTTVKSMNTNITLTRTSSKLVTSRKLTTSFYITNYDPISLNLGY